MLRSIKVKDYMAANLITFTPEMDVMVAVNLLVEKRISGAPVLDEHGNLVGILSERDCVRVALETCYHGEQAGVVADYMNRDVHTVDGDMSILELARLFVDRPFRRYPVIDGNRLAGQISIRDVLRALEKISAPQAHAK